MGRMLFKAAYCGEKEGQQMVNDLKCFTRARASKELKNSVGQKIWRETQDTLDEICTPAEGPHSYAVLDALCRKFKVQAVVFSGLLEQPTYIFPLDEAESRPDLPCIFLQEIVTLDPEAKAQFHLNLIVRPERIFHKKFLCQVCFQVVSNNSMHRYCSRRVTCFYCLRKKLKPGDWYDTLMIRKYCPADLPDHPAVNYLEKEQCKNCLEEIFTSCCLARHIPNCNGRHKCESCSELIIARRGENLDDKVALHQCGVKKCLLCFEDVDLADKKIHCCKMSPITFPRGYNQQGYFDIETFELADKTLRDNVFHFSYESKIAGNFHGITFTH